MEQLLQKRTLLPRDSIYPGMFDLPKGLFMLYVLFYHALIGFYPVWEYHYSPEISKRLVDILLNVSGRGMISLLFLCCGYSWRKKKMEKAVKGQLSAMLVPYLVTGGAVTATVLLYGMFPGVSLWKELRYSSLPFLLGFCPGADFLGSYINSIGALWCVVVYFFGGILLNWILQEKENWIQLCLAVLLACIGLLLKEKTIVFCFQQVLICTGYMYLGWLMKKTNFLTREIPAYLLILMLLAGPVLGAFGYFDMSQHSFENGMVDLISGLLVGTGLLVLALRCNRWDGKLMELVRWMGRENFLICCVHSFWMLMPPLLTGILFQPLMNGSVPKAVAVMVIFAFLFVTGVGGAYLCKRVQVAFSRRKNRREAGT